MPTTRERIEKGNIILNKFFGRDDSKYLVAGLNPELMKVVGDNMTTLGADV